MADLSSYIKEMLQKGYDIASIKNNLLQYGYKQDDIDRAYYSITNHKKKLPLIPIIIVLVVIVIAIVAFLLLSRGGGEEIPLDVTISIDKPSAAPGEQVSVSVSLISDADSIAVVLKYELVNGARSILLKSESVPIENLSRHTAKLTIPLNTPQGDYNIKVSTKALTKTATVTSKITITKETKIPPDEESCFDNILNQDEVRVDCGGVCDPCKVELECPDNCDDGEDNTLDHCDATTEYRCVHEIMLQCGDGICNGDETAQSCVLDCDDGYESKWDKLDDITKLAQEDANAAIKGCEQIDPNIFDDCLLRIAPIVKKPNLCDEITDDIIKAECFKNVALETKNSVLCENIEKVTRRDGCYAAFVANYEDYTLCDKLSDPNFKRSCELLRSSQI